MPLSEFELIQRYFSSYGRGASVDLSVGDDCAILSLASNERLATSIDTLVQGVHFFEDSFPEDVGFRAVSVAASDLAAMGASPIGMTLAMTVPEVDELWLHAFAQGMAAASTQYRLPLVGGDTTKGPCSITIQVMGALPTDKALLREGAQAGDRLCVSGVLGDAAGGLAILQGKWQAQPEHAEYLLQRFNRPEARLDLGRALLGSATAAIDISDGLLADAGHIAAASGVKVCIDSQRLPLSEALQSHADPEQVRHWALTGGDDYELCFSLPVSVPIPAGCSCIGSIEEGSGLLCDSHTVIETGYTHF
ncbi:MAG: thiamine-phosphate kinase [Pseudomonadota bacterium]